MALGYNDTSKSPKKNHFLEVTFIFIIIAIPSLCTSQRPQSECSEGQVRCYDLTCTTGKACDFHADCHDRSDERDCVSIDQGIVGPPVPVGSNKTLTCRIQVAVQGKNASHLVWYQLLNREKILLPIDTYSVIDENTTDVTIANISHVGRHTYICQYPNDNFYQNGAVINVYVGIVPQTPTLECFRHNMLSFWCQFTETEYTGLQKNFTMEYKLSVPPPGSPKGWRLCTQYNLPEYGPNTCYVDDAKVQGFSTKVQVRHSNSLGTSPPKTITFDPLTALKPHPPSNPRVTRQTSRSLDLEWEHPKNWGNTDAYVLEFRIRYTELTNPSVSHNITTTDLQTSLSSLLPFRSYKIEIQCKHSPMETSQWSDWVDFPLPIKTLQDAPEAEVQKLREINSTQAKDVYKRTVTLKWDDVPQGLQNGEILGYAVYFQSDAGDSGMERTAETSIQLSNIDKFHAYTVKVTAYTSIGEGPNATLTLPDLSTAPLPPDQAEIIARSNSSIEVKWEEPSNPSAYITAYELQWSSNNVDWSELVAVPASNLNYVFQDLTLYTAYTVRLRIRCTTVVSEWAILGPEYTFGRAPSQALFHEPRKLSGYLTELQWEEPTLKYGQIEYYTVRYRPVIEEGQPAIPWQQASKTEELGARVRVNCSLVKGRSPFLFEVTAVNNMGKSDPTTRELYMCDNVEVITIVVSVLAVCFCVTLLLCCILCVRQSDITKPAPEPYFIDAILKPAEASKFQWKDNKRSPKHEKESFDTLRSADSYTELLSPVIERMSSKDSSSASTDQGIHDMDIDSVDLKNGGPSSNWRRCNRYSSGMGQSIVSEGGHGTLRSNSNPGMEVLSEDYEDAVFEEIPQDMDDGSTPCLSHTYARSSMSCSPALSPNEDEIGSSSSLLSNSSSGPTSLPPYSQMASNPHQRLSSSGSDTSGVNYHMMSSQGLAPINTSNESNETGSLAYAKLSQIPTAPPADVVVDVDNAAAAAAAASDEDAAEYHQIGLREPMLNKSNTTPDNQSAAQTNKSPSRFNIPSVHIGSFVQPQKEFIVATALMPNQPQQQQMQEEHNDPSGLDPCCEAKENGDVRVPIDDHSYSIVGSDSTSRQPVKPPNPPTSARPKITCGNSSYVPNTCLNGFSIPNGTPKNCGTPSAPCNQGYVPNNSPPTQGVFPPPQVQSPSITHSPPKVNRGKIEGYAPATPQAMAAIMGGKPMNNQAYVPNTAVV